METEQETETSPNEREDSIVCFCYRLTTRDLKDAYKRSGSLKGVEETTRAGTGCTGCKVLLHSLFGEEASDHYESEHTPSVGTACMKPGTKTQKGFIIANDLLESTVYSSNGVAPQLGSCDSTSELEYTLVNSDGIPVIHRKETISTNSTFEFNTRNENLKRPFVGMFHFTMNRSNLGASRFNIYWSNGNSATATHENSGSGRPKVFLPIVVTRDFLQGPNTMYLAIMNPHHKLAPIAITAFDVDTKEQIVWNSQLSPYCSTWINANEYLFGPVLKRYPSGRFVLKISTTTMDQFAAATVYFFVHNETSNTWTSNHL